MLNNICEGNILKEFHCFRIIAFKKKVTSAILSRILLMLGLKFESMGTVVIGKSG